MERSFLQRYLEAFHHIEGWFCYDAALLFMAYNEIIARSGIGGDVLEIGVHHGLSSIAIAALRGPGKRFYAVDLFENLQARNISASGAGDRQIFERNMKGFYPDTSFVKVIAGPSTDVDAAQLGATFSFCHIDGGHSREETFHDLKLCHSLLLPGGLLALDDYFNPQFPGVCEGAVQFLLSCPGALRPLAIAYNKVVFQKQPAPAVLNDRSLAAFPGVESTTVQLWDTPALLISSAFRAELDLHASTPQRLVRKGEIRRAALTPAHSRIDANRKETVALPVKIVNMSHENLPTGENVFGLSYHVLSPSGEVLRYDNDRAWLSAPLPPGETKTISLPIRVPAEPGEFQIEIDLVWEQVMWFKDVGNPTALVRLTVR